MATVTQKLLYTAPAAQTITLTSLANAAAREMTVFDNTSNLFLDVLLSMKTKTVNTALNTGSCFQFWAYALIGDGASYTYPATGADAGITVATDPSLIFVARAAAVLHNVALYVGEYSVAAAFGGVLPTKFGIIVQNLTGQALSATAGDHAVYLRGVQNQFV